MIKRQFELLPSEDQLQLRLHTVTPGGFALARLLNATRTDIEQQILEMSPYGGDVYQQRKIANHQRLELINDFIELLSQLAEENTHEVHQDEA